MNILQVNQFFMSGIFLCVPIKYHNLHSLNDSDAFAMVLLWRRVKSINLAYQPLFAPVHIFRKRINIHLLIAFNASVVNVYTFYVDTSVEWCMIKLIKLV